MHHPPSRYIYTFLSLFYQHIFFYLDHISLLFYSRPILKHGDPSKAIYFLFFFFFSFWFDFVVTGMIDFSNNTHTELSVYTIPQRETKKHYDNVINWRNIEQLFVFQQLALMIDFFFFSSTDLSSSSAC